MIDTHSEEWRRKCEARWVLKLPTVAARREYLARVEKARGAKAVEELKEQIMKHYNRPAR
jgi:hypothetical protein